jgi:hypothetical protein
LPSKTLLAVNVAAPVPPLATGSVPVTPVVKGKPVALVKVADAGVPSVGVTKVGEVANTKAPVPVSSDTAVAKLADDGVPRKVATPVPNDVMPVPPFATASVPAKVIVPDDVTGPPEVVKPVVPPDTSTLVTVPEPAPLNAISIDPAPGVIVMPVPAVNDAFVNVLPVLLPISS